MAKWVINNLVDGIVDDLMKKNVLTENELRKVEKGVNLVVKNTENLIDNVVEKTKMVHQILVENALNVQQRLSLSEYLGLQGSQLSLYVLSLCSFCHLLFVSEE